MTLKQINGLESGCQIICSFMLFCFVCLVGGTENSKVALYFSNYFTLFSLQSFDLLRFKMLMDFIIGKESYEINLLNYRDKINLCCLIGEQSF